MTQPNVLPSKRHTYWEGLEKLRKQAADSHGAADSRGAAARGLEHPVYDRPVPST